MSANRRIDIGPCILAIDQGTTSSRAMVFDGRGEVVAIAQQEFPQRYPHSGWVEHDPEAIWDSVLAVSRAALGEAEARGGRVCAVGIANQRETALLWERRTGKPIHNAIVWQDRRTAGLCRQLSADLADGEVQSRSGLLIDPYFSATKISWMLDHVPGARQRADRGELAFGTIDSFLIWRLTGGRVHATDATNASRTNLFNIHTQVWDEELLRLFNVPSSLLPQVHDNSFDYGLVDASLLGRAIPILGVAGDQQAAAVGQCCFRPGQIKSTYGTGCFVLMNTGAEAVASKHRLLTTVGYRLDGRVSYAVEGSIFVAGAAVKWLRDGLGLIATAGETARLASSLEDNAGLYLVPAFAGLGAPWWDPDARGAIFGLTQASGPAEFARAALESVCYQTFDLFDAVGDDSRNPEVLRVDGGMVSNDWLMQFLADILDMPVERPAIGETTALGAAYLAGMKAGLYEGLEQLEGLWRRDARFTPQCDPEQRQRLLAGWRDAVGRVLSRRQV